MPDALPVSGTVTNPLDGTVLVDSGVLEGPNVVFSAILGASVTARIDIQIRDTTDTIPLQTIPVFVAAGQSFALPSSLQFPVDPGQKIKLVVNGNILGTVAGSLTVAQG
jgi:hypothetical protein